MQDESRSMGDVAIDMDSQTNPLQLQLIDEQVDRCMFFTVRGMCVFHVPAQIVLNEFICIVVTIAATLIRRSINIRLKCASLQ